MTDAPCVIGKGIEIKGNVSGSEDLLVLGHVEGHITLANHITVAEGGAISGDVTTRSISIDGEVSGTIQAEETIAINAAAKVAADLRAPRVMIEEGALFKGRIDMDVDLPKNI